jgi:hypothetical protein
VLLGPGNILRQSARAPVHDGAWSAGRLAPGRYRVQVEGGANTVLVCDPPFVTVDVSDGVAEAPTIRVLREM